jgi:hypothetical protein
MGTTSPKKERHVRCAARTMQSIGWAGESGAHRRDGIKAGVEGAAISPIPRSIVSPMTCRKVAQYYQVCMVKQAQ